MAHPSDEDRLITALLARLQPAPAPSHGRVLVGPPADDVALLETGGRTEIICTSDTLVEDVHFRQGWSRPEDVGWKALAVNLSDLASTGAQPLAALVSLSVPKFCSVRWLRRLYDGISDCSREYGCPIAGGDTTRSPGPIYISVSAIGSSESRLLTRGSAGSGDLICVTGTLGESAAGLELMRQGTLRSRSLDGLLQAHRRPRPQLAAGQALAGLPHVTACMDLSDGLAQDLPRLARLSGCGFSLDADRLPVSDHTRTCAGRLGLDPVELALTGGEDYQLLFTMGPAGRQSAAPALAASGTCFTIVGRLGGRGRRLNRSGRRAPWPKPSFVHFG